MSKNTFDIIIIGGGLGGLTAGATLAKLGKKVLLLEQHYVVGGCATTFKRKDYVMEVGLHEMDGLFEKDLKLDIFKFLEVEKNVDLIQVPELYRMKSKNLDFVFPHGNDESIEALIEKFPSEEKGIRGFMALMDGVLEELPSFPTKKWKQNLKLPFMPLTHPNVVKASRKTVGEWLDYYFKDEDLKLLLQANLLYYHDDPYTMSMIYFSAAQSSYIQGGGHFIKGGSQKLSDYLASVIEQHNGQVQVGKKVNKIIIENGKAVGVEFTDKYNTSKTHTVFGSKIIANTAVPLVKKLLPEKEGKKLNHKIKNLKAACSLLSIYIGFKKEIKALGNKYYSTFITDDNVSSIKDVYSNNKGEWDKRNFVFVDYSQIDSQLAPEGKSFGAICSADYLTDWESLSPEEYTQKKEEVAEIFFNRLEEHFPGIKDEIEYYEVGTSKTIQRYTMNPEGTPYGFAQTAEQAGRNRTPLTSPIKNLHFAGAWTFPGGGFTGAIISGFLSAQEVNKKIKTTVSDYGILEDENVIELIKKECIADNTYEFTFTKPKGFEYQAGQYGILELINPKFNEVEIPHRALSFVSHPDEPYLRFALRLSDSSYKKSLMALDDGAKCKCYGPIGDFTQKKLSQQDKGIVFIVSGIGITPILPLIKEYQKKNQNTPITLLYSNKTLEASAYHDHFIDLESENFSYHTVLTATEKRIDKSYIKGKIENLEQHRFCIVGGRAFVVGMQKELQGLEIPSQDIIADDFG
ncbi:FAD-dependent oxidoreductase [Flammeovirga aprica]|uniref:NAD(P)-binding protein n=1 Tax=Flammeovirga aprica JL-4 TaxID=694437 RepID=A0A7X9XAK3_9BACT|nr:FAD-dependent oxidoreductase [Flammeovirga aprica]NME69760.1 NAD(P)-binding protein [Flammeovirga aprica JL-4]